MGCSQSKPADPRSSVNETLPIAPAVKSPPVAAQPTAVPAAPHPQVTEPPRQPSPPPAAPAPEPTPVPTPTPAPAPAPGPAASAPKVGGSKDDQSEAFGLLLCGAGESGKTTFTRQLKLRFLDGISQEERMGFVSTIRGNLVETMKILLVWMEHHDREVSEDVLEAAEAITNLNPFGCEFTAEVGDSLSQLWQDAGVQEAFQHRDETEIPDHMDYFFEKIDDLVDEEYVPTDEDVLKARIRSIGIDQVTLSLDEVLIRIYDVGGQRNERSKWEKVQSEVGGAIFLVSFADFDKPMFEDLPKIVARINDAMNCFEDVTHRQVFLDKPIFLVCNKFDVFTEKVRNTDCFSRVFPEFQGNAHDENECYEYLVGKFIERSNPPLPERPIIQFRQNALDSDQVVRNATEICKYIRENYYEEAEE